MTQLDFHKTSLEPPSETGEATDTIEMEFKLRDGSGSETWLIARYLRQDSGDTAVFKECVNQQTGNSVTLPQEAYRRLTGHLLQRGYCDTVKQGGNIVGEYRILDYDTSQI